MSRKKTRKEYVDELKTRNPNVEIIGEYIDANTDTTHHCLAHDVFWETKPSRVLNGHGCIKCKVERFQISNTKTQSEYIEEVKLNNSNIEVLEEYINAKTKILHKCVKHNVIWAALPTNILKGCGCHECMKEKIGNSNSASHDEYVAKLSNINQNIINGKNYSF